MEWIRKYFEKLVDMPEKDWQLFESFLEEKQLRPGDVLLKAGTVETHLSFVETGTLRYYVPLEEREVTFAFVFEGNFVSAYDSFISQKPADYYIQCLTATTLWSIRYDHLEQIYRQTSVGNKIGRLAAEELFLRKSKRELSLLIDSAEQRYLNLLEERPDLLQRIPLKYLASYIGVTPQALSRIRKRIS